MRFLFAPVLLALVSAQCDLPAADDEAPTQLLQGLSAPYGELARDTAALASERTEATGETGRYSGGYNVGRYAGRYAGGYNVGRYAGGYNVGRYAGGYNVGRYAGGYNTDRTVEDDRGE